MPKLSDLEESVLEVFGVLEDNVTNTHMDWNSRWKVRLESDGDEWFPVVGWNHYVYNSDCGTKPIILHAAEEDGKGSHWEEVGDVVEWRLVTRESDWLDLLEEAQSNED